MKTKPEIATHGCWWRGRVTFTWGLHRIGCGQNLLSWMAGVTFGPGRGVEEAFLCWSLDYCRLRPMKFLNVPEPPEAFTRVMDQTMRDLLAPK